MSFGYTRSKKFSMGNRVAYKYNLVDVQTTGSTMNTPLKKITGYLIETRSPGTSEITVVTNTEKDANGRARLTFAADAESQGDILVVGLL